MTHPTRKCPSCGSHDVEHKNTPARIISGVLITLICGLLAVPTLGVSAIFMIWGIMLAIKRPTCNACGWRKGQNSPRRLASR